MFWNYAGTGWTTTKKQCLKNIMQGHNTEARELQEAAAGILIQHLSYVQTATHTTPMKSGTL